MNLSTTVTVPIELFIFFLLIAFVVGLLVAFFSASKSISDSYREFKEASEEEDFKVIQGRKFF